MARTTDRYGTTGWEDLVGALFEQLEAPTSETTRDWANAVAECSLGATIARKWFGERVVIHRLDADDLAREWRSEFDRFGRLWISARELSPGSEFVPQWIFSWDELSAKWFSTGAARAQCHLACINETDVLVEPEAA